MRVIESGAFLHRKKKEQTKAGCKMKSLFTSQQTISMETTVYEPDQDVMQSFCQFLQANLKLKVKEWANAGSMHLWESYVELAMFLKIWHVEEDFMQCCTFDVHEGCIGILFFFLLQCFIFFGVLLDILWGRHSDWVIRYIKQLEDIIILCMLIFYDFYFENIVGMKAIGNFKWRYILFRAIRDI